VIADQEKDSIKKEYSLLLLETEELSNFRVTRIFMKLCNNGLLTYKSMIKKTIYFCMVMGVVTLSAWLSAEEDVYVEDVDDVVVLPNCSLKYSVETTAKKSTIWRLWSDVENWKKFDTILKYSYLENDAKFEVGAVGYLKAKGAPKTKFELVEVKESESFIESLKIPLWQTIELQRYFEVNENGLTTFTHEVNFKGGLRQVMYAILAGTFKKELKHVMTNLKEVAEAEEQQALQ